MIDINGTIDPEATHKIVWLSFGCRQSSIRQKAHDGSERQCPLVNGLEEIRQDHDHQNALVNLATELIAALLRDLNPRPSRVLGELLVDLVRGMEALLNLVGHALNLCVQRVLAAALVGAGHELWVANFGGRHCHLDVLEYVGETRDFSPPCQLGLETATREIGEQTEDKRQPD